MKKLFFVTIILLLIGMNSCSSQTHIKNTIEDTLRERYGIEIEFIDFRDERLNRNEYYFLASLKNNPELIFGGSFNAGNGTIGDTYRNMNLHYQAKQDVKRILNSFYKKYAIQAVIFSGNDIKKEDEFNYHKIINSYPDSAEFIVRLYLAKDVTNTNKTEMLTGIQNVISYLKNKHIGKVVIFADFFDEEYFNKINIEKETFCFNEVTYHCFEYKDFEYYTHIKHHLQLDIHQYDPVPSIDELYSSLKEGSKFNK